MARPVAAATATAAVAVAEVAEEGWVAAAAANQARERAEAVKASLEVTGEYAAAWGGGMAAAQAAAGWAAG